MPGFLHRDRVRGAGVPGQAVAALMADRRGPRESLRGARAPGHRRVEPL